MNRAVGYDLNFPEPRPSLGERLEREQKAMAEEREAAERGDD